MTTPTLIKSNLTGISYEVYPENNDHLYVVSEGETVLVCNIDDDVQTIVEDHERNALN